MKIQKFSKECWEAMGVPKEREKEMGKKEGRGEPGRKEEEARGRVAEKGGTLGMNSVKNSASSPVNEHLYCEAWGKEM